MDKYYYVFVLGYDLLNKRLSQSNSAECDISYERCVKVYDAFVDSGYNDDKAYSVYENLQKFVENNKFE